MSGEQLCRRSTFWRGQGQNQIRSSNRRQCWDIIFYTLQPHDDVIEWKHFPRYWPFVRGIHGSPANSPHKGQWRGGLIFSLICAWINGWVNNRRAGDSRRHRGHYDVIVMVISQRKTWHASSDPCSPISFYFKYVSAETVYEKLMETIKTTSLEKRLQQYLAKLKHYLRHEKHENKANTNQGIII